MKGQTKYIITAPIGNVIAPAGPVNEKQLRDFGASMSDDPAWREKFEKDPFDQVLEYFKAADYTIRSI